MESSIEISDIGIRSGRAHALTALTRQVALYRELSKSGIVTLVLISVLGGYLIGQSPEIPLDPMRFLATLAGVLFLASGSSALNQLQDREVDAEMPRTAKRPLPSGRLSRLHASVFVAATLSVGLGLLSAVDRSVLLLGIAAVVCYNGFYTLWWKRHWAYGAVPGAIPGALPILMGYAAAHGSAFAPGGIYLFCMLFYWQMPHFWSLALRFQADYARGKIPTLPVAYGTEVTLRQILVWCVGYLALALMAPLFFPLSWIYGVSALAAGGKVFLELARFTRNTESKRWLGFFLWVNFSLVLFIAAIVLDLWRYKILAPYSIGG